MLRFSRVFGLILATALFIGCESTGEKRQEEAEYQDEEVRLNPMPTVQAPYRGSRITIRRFNDSAYRRAVPGLGPASTSQSSRFFREAGFAIVVSMDDGRDTTYEEMDGQRTGYGEERSRTKIGKHQHARYLFVGHITRLEIKSKGSSNSIDIGSYYGHDKQARDQEIIVELSGKIVDLESGLEIASETASQRRTLKSKGGRFRIAGIGFGSSTTVDVTAPAGELVQRCLHELAGKLVLQLNDSAPAPQTTAKN